MWSYDKTWEAVVAICLADTVAHVKQVESAHDLLLGHYGMFLRVRPYTAE